MNNLYFYDGPVMKFDTCLTWRWQASTYAPSEQKAKSNLAHRFKNENGMVVSTKITLPGKLVAAL